MGGIAGTFSVLFGDLPLNRFINLPTVNHDLFGGLESESH